MSKKMHGNKEAKKPKRVPPVASTLAEAAVPPVAVAVRKPHQVKK